MNRRGDGLSHRCGAKFLSNVLAVRLDRGMAQSHFSCDFLLLVSDCEEGENLDLPLGEAHAHGNLSPDDRRCLADRSSECSEVQCSAGSERSGELFGTDVFDVIGR